MCGICGYIGVEPEGLLEAMTATLLHRGPDDDGFFRSADVGLGFRRLSIIDLEGGWQPIENEDGSLVLIANGEIYNHRELRDGLEQRGHKFRSKSDIEVILHLYEEEGPDCLQRLNGMFAIALFDKQRRRLFLARDRLGIKPLYYARRGEGLLFASEMKAILQDPTLDRTLNPTAVHDYLALRYVPGPGTMLKEVQKLPAGHHIVMQDGRFTMTRWWQPPLYEGPFEGSDTDYLDGFAEHFERSVKRRLIADVPLGAYLSGGLDSSVIVAAMKKAGAGTIKTFTVGFDYEHDELTAAAETARLLECDHTEIPCRPEHIRDLPDIVHHLDEPLGDAIVLPMYQLSREARKSVTVILAGEGADETLGGYLFHKALLSGHQLARWIPGFVRRGLMNPAIRLAPPALLNLAFSYPARLGNRGKLKVLDFLNLLEPHQLGDAYRHLISLFDDRDTVDLYSDGFRTQLNGALDSTRESFADSNAPYLNRILQLQFDHWLPDDILQKQDKMSMAHSIEARVPFMDHELVEYALRIPPRLKIQGLRSKEILRRYARRMLPDAVARRRKMPFYIPIEKFFQEPTFREMADHALSADVIRDRGILNPDGVTRLRDSVREGDFVFAKQVLSLVVLELWFQDAMKPQEVAA